MVFILIYFDVYKLYSKYVTPPIVLAINGKNIDSYFNNRCNLCFSRWNIYANDYEKLDQTLSQLETKERNLRYLACRV